MDGQTRERGCARRGDPRCDRRADATPSVVLGTRAADAPRPLLPLAAETWTGGVAMAPDGAAEIVDKAFCPTLGLPKT